MPAEDKWEQYAAPSQPPATSTPDKWAQFEAPTEQTTQKPGFFKRLGQSVGVPTSKEEFKQLSEESSKPQWADILGPTGRTIAGYAKTAGRGLKEGLQEAGEAGQQYGKGEVPLGQAVGKMVHGAAHTSLQALPFIGPSIETAGEDIAGGNYRGAAGGLTGVIGQVAAPEIAERGGAALKGVEAGDLAAKAKAVSKLARREVTAHVPVLNRFESLRKPSFGEYAAALKAKANPQAELFKRTPKLGDFPAVETPTTQPKVAIPTSAWPPERPSALQPRQFKTRADVLEDKALQEANRENLEGHGRQAASQEKREWFARNQPGATKGELASQFPAVESKVQLGKVEPVANAPGVVDYPIVKGGERIGHARIAISGDEARVGWLGPDERATGQPLNLGSAETRALKTQFEKENPGVKLKWNPGSATHERSSARAVRRSQPQVPTEQNMESLLRRSIQQAKARKLSGD